MPRTTLLLLSVLAIVLPAAARGVDEEPAIAARFASELEQRYVFAERGHAAAMRIRTQLAERAYDGLHGQVFARAATADAYAVTRDRHVHLFYNAYPLPPESDPGAHLSDAQRRAATQRAARLHFGFADARMLHGNIGYVDIRTFFAAEDTAPAMAAAMRSIARADAVIIDERLNNGGHPSTVAMLMSYFFPKGSRIHVEDIALRVGNHDKMLSFYTTDVDGPRFSALPLYVLTSRGTFSAGEGFAYEMQALKRAIIVGQRTFGGANGGGEYRLGKDFSAFIPTARSVSPTTHANWEGVGVKPDIAVSGRDTFKAAYLAALRSKAATASSAERPALAEWIISVEKSDPAALAQRLGIFSTMPPRRVHTQSR